MLGKYNYVSFGKKKRGGRQVRAIQIGALLLMLVVLVKTKNAYDQRIEFFLMMLPKVMVF